MTELNKRKKEESGESLFKFILVGNSSSGKTCLLHQFIEGKGTQINTNLIRKSKQNSTYTIGVEFGSKIEKINDKQVRIQLWDTAGQERFRSVARTYYRGAVGAIIVFDLTNLESFHAVQNWVLDVRELANKEVCIAVCGNKSDLQYERVVQTNEAIRLCDSLGVTYIETSALTGDNVQEAFISIARQIMDKIEMNRLDPAFQPRAFLGRKVDSFDIDKPKQCQQC